MTIGLLMDCLFKHRHAKHARAIFLVMSICRTVHSNDLVNFFWVAMYSKKEAGNLYFVNTTLHR